MSQEQRPYYLQSSHLNPSYQQMKMNPKMELRTPKPPKPPEKPLMPYMRYSKKVWEQVKNSNPHLKLWEVGKIIGQMWRELPDEEKNIYMEEYDAEKAQYTEALRQYHSSPAYQSWLVAKERAEKMIEEHDQERKQAMARVRDRSMEMGQADLRESYIIEDNEEDAEEQFTAKHVAAARFQRNHRLMQEILSDSRLPDPGQLITQNRLNTLRSQVEQLKNHKRNLCQEIECCESRHTSKLKRIQEDSEKFLSGYKKLTESRPVITDNQFAEMIVKAKSDLKHEEEERLARYLAEVEMRRRKQRQQREAEIAAETERRLQEQQQQQQQLLEQEKQPVQCVDKQALPTESVQISTQDEKNVSTNQVPMKSPSQPVSIKPDSSAPETSSDAAMHFAPSTLHVPNTGDHLTQPGHTQHHYPPPPPNYQHPPNVASPSTGNSSLTSNQPPFTQQVQFPGGNKTSLQDQNNQSLTSASSSTSVNSEASRVQNSEGYTEEKKVNGPSAEEMSTPAPRSLESVGASRPQTEYVRSVQSPAPRPSGPQNHPHMMQHPMMGSMVPPGSGQSASSHPQFGYDHGAPPGSVPPGYYHPGASQQSPGPHAAGFGPQGRSVPFGHAGYMSGGNFQSAAHPSTGDHPPPPPMYVQHMPQQPQMQQHGQVLVSSATHATGHPAHPSASAMGWHPSGYPPQYGPPRYIGPGGPVSYVGHPMRHLPPGAAAGGYAMHPYPGMHHPSMQHQQTPSNMPETNISNQQSIPAPPPYQQQQQQQTQSQHGYYTASQPSSGEYGGPTHPYGAMPQVDSSGSHSQSEGSATGGPPHSENAGHLATPSHHSAMYYQGYAHSQMQGSYGPPPGASGGGFYAVPPQASGVQYSQASWVGNYPPQTQMTMQQPTTHGGFPTHSHMQQQPNTQVPSATGHVQTTMVAPAAPVVDPAPSGGVSSRPPSVSSQGQS